MLLLHSNNVQRISLGSLLVQLTDYLAPPIRISYIPQYYILLCGP
nr:MAG TPA: hypothetical protein [Bacteriophage sp.]